ARRVHAPSPVETVPVHRQTLDEVIGGSGSIEQAETVNLITQLTAQVLEVPVKIGDLIKKGDLLVRWDDRLIKATVEANREYVEADKIKIRAETTFPAFPSEVFKGTIFKIDPNIDPITRTFTTYIKIENPDFRLKPGLSGFARIRRTAKDVLAVPSISILNPSGEQASVFVVDSNHANLRKVHPGIVVDAMTEITDGLKEGDKVVTVGQFYLKDNDKIRTTF